MNDIYFWEEYGVTMFHVLYPIKYLLLSKRIMTCVSKVPSDDDDSCIESNSGGSLPEKKQSSQPRRLGYRKIPFITAFFMLMLLGEGGGSLGRVLTGQRVGVFENDYKIHVLVAVWSLLNYVLPEFIVLFLFDWLNVSPWNLLLVLPHEFRRGMALCSLLASYKKQIGDQSWIAPIVLAALGACLGSFTFSTLRFGVLLNHEERLNEYREFKELVSQKKRPTTPFEHIPFKVLYPFICSFVYSIVAYDFGYKSFHVVPLGIEISTRFIVACSFVVLAVWPYVTSLFTALNNKGAAQQVTAQGAIVSEESISTNKAKSD